MGSRRRTRWGKAAAGAPADRRLGTFLGVFTPSILTILGVVLYLRTGWVVGHVGLLPALAIVVLAHSITVSTALSVSAIATNMRVGAGGAYYMVSRSLGLEIGGAIGIPLFLAQTFSVTLYAFGLAESLQLLWPEIPLRTTAAVTVVAVALIASRGAQMALKLQLPIMAAIALSLASLYAGTSTRAAATLPLWRSADSEVGFWVVFAVFFPAVTGIMAGISLSGDLKDPQKAIPRGTLTAVLTGFVIYLTVPIALAVAADPERLIANNLIWFELAAVPLLIFPGLWGAIFSSAVGSILGAPRTLEALIGDRVLPRVPGWLTKRVDVPQVLSAGVALAAVGLGDLNAVAPVLTMFFLTTYGVVNLVAGLEQLSGAPSYRPTIRVPWAVSLAGAAGCIWVMALINRAAAAAAVVVEVMIYLALRRRALHAAWGDLRYGALMSLVRATLLRLRRLPVDPRNWRPHILVFAEDPHKRRDLLRFAAWLNQGRGILTVCHMMVGELEELAPQIPEQTRRDFEDMESDDLSVFTEVDVVPDLESGMLNIVQANGIAGLTSNTMMLGWSDKTERRGELLRCVRKAALLGKSSLLCRIAPRRWAARLQRIDVWWGGLQNNGDMMLLFAHLLSLNPEWAEAEISVKMIASNAMTHDDSKRSLEHLIRRSRISAETEVLPREEGRSVQETIQEVSGDADLVFLGLQDAAPGEEEAYGERLASLIGDLPTVIFLRAAGPFAGRLIDG